MTGTDMVTLRVAEGEGTGQMIHRWPHDWPPPPVLWHTTGITGQYLIDPEGTEAEVLAEIRGAMLVVEYRLTRASAIPEPAPEGEHWCRGAEYVRAPVE